MLNTLTMPGTFWFYSVVALVGALVLYFVLPETEGRTLMEIERHFAGKRPTDDPTTGASDNIKGNQQRQHDIIREIPLTVVVATSANGSQHSQGFQKQLVQRRPIATFDPNVELRSEMTRL